MVKLSKVSKSSAPGPYLGYSQQQVRLLHYLLTCSDAGCRVSMEHLDDVAVHYADGTLLLEQDKSATASNPLADTSVELWKSFAHWLDLIAAGKAQLDRCQFRIYVTPVRNGAWATLLSKAETAEEIAPLLAKAKKLLTRIPVPACGPYLKKFVDAAPEVQLGLVKRTSIVSCDDNPLGSVRTLLQTTLAPELADHVCAMGLGMAVARVDDLLRTGRDPLVDADEFKGAFRAAARKSNMPGYLSDMAGAPSTSAIEGTLVTHPVFVQQLELIQAEQDERLRAVSDFLQASANKVKWAECLLVHAGSLDEFDNTLTRHHGLVAKELKETHDGAPELKIGKLTYLCCSQYQAQLEGHSVPDFFVPGCFHHLADRSRIGWHPDYLKKLIA